MSERLPNLSEQAAELFAGDEEFRELCDEYRVCCETLMRLEGQPGHQEPLRREYVALQLRLEGELLRYFSSRGKEPR